MSRVEQDQRVWRQRIEERDKPDPSLRLRNGDKYRRLEESFFHDFV